MKTFSDTFQQVHRESEFYCLQLQADFLEEFMVKTIFPTHLQLLAIPACFLQFIVWCIHKCWKKINGLNPDIKVEELDASPMFVRGNNMFKCKEREKNIFLLLGL